MKKYLRKPRLTLVIFSVLIIAVFLGQAVFAASDEDNINLLYMEKFFEFVRDQYEGGLSDSKMVDGAVRGILNSLDDYTTYYTKEEKEAFLDSVSGIFGGIGITMEVSGDYIVVSKVLPATPAERAGILQGDKIVEADGVNLVGMAAEKAAYLIRGDVGTVVKIGVLRNESKEIKYFEITREVIKVNPVTYEIRNGIGYIKLEQFNENTDEYMTKALEAMDRNRITKIILDLRDNPGGSVAQATALAQKFVPKGIITKLDFRSESYDDIEYYSHLEKPKYELAVLVNGMTASASEIVAGAIQDTGAGKLVGTKTFGKARFQSLIPVLSRDAFFKYINEGILAVNAYDLQSRGIMPLEEDIAGYAKLTLGVYYTPKGRMIDGQGLTPDIVAEDPKPMHDVNINSIQKLTKTVEHGLNGQGIDVYNAEKILRFSGYNITAVDNTLDIDTVEALKYFQRKSGLNVNGILDKQTQDALNAELDRLIAKYDMQYAAAVEVLTNR
ncbi:MAG: S41 family peptidase [Acetivibrionales bacterium]